MEGEQKAVYKWLGGYTSSYSFLGDKQARMLGVGFRVVNQKLPAWLKSPPVELRQGKGGASRHDPSFRGWG